MKLRSILPAAALILSVGIGHAVAEDPAPTDEIIRRETSYTPDSFNAANGESRFSRFFYGSPESNALTAVLPEYGGTVETDRGQVRSAEGNAGDAAGTASDEAGSPATARTTAPPAGREPFNAESADASPYRAEDEFQIYDLAIPFDGIVSEQSGLAGRTDRDGFPEVSESRSETSGDPQTQNNGIYSSLVFDKNVITNTQNRPQIVLGGPYASELKDGEEFARSPLSVPISMLVVMLCVCLITVLYTTAGEKLKK